MDARAQIAAQDPGTGDGAGTSKSTITKAVAGRRLRRPRLHDGGRYLWILPAVILVAGVVYYSVGYTVWLSTLNWDGVSPNPASVGLQNYVQVFKDPVFWLAMKHMVIFAATIPIELALGCFAAILLHSRVRASTIYKVVLFVPVVIAPAVMAPIFRQLFDVNGQFNHLLEAVGLGGLAHAWLADPHTALYVLIAINVWEWTGFSFLLYFASLGQIDPAILEAARLDGAGNWRLIRSIIVPLSRATTLTLLILGVIGTLRTFDIPYLITGGGPAQSTQFLTTYLYQEGVTNFHAGYGAALTVVLMALAILLTIPQVRRYRKVGASG